MKGVILCSKCRKKLDRVCSCGNYKCLIRINHNGKYYEYRRDGEGDILTYQKAQNRLIEINEAIRKKRFYPEEYTDQKIKERKFENQIEKWLNGKEQQEKMNELSPGTVRSYRGYVENYYPFFSGLDVREIELEHLTNFKDTLDKVSIKTRKNIMNALRNFFFWMKERGVIKEMPIFPKIKGDDSKTRQAIDVDLQEEALLKIPEQHRDIIEFLMETGLRPGEACALLVEHINTRHNIARIERTYVSGNIIKETVKQKRKRIMPLSDRAYEIAKKNMQDKTQGQFLFINPRTNRGYYPKAVWYEWRQHSGVDVDLYSATRHSFATQLIQDNDVTMVKELMGHSDIRTTEKYLHMKVTKLTDIVNARKKIVRLVCTDKNTAEKTK